jgi:macrodomain Ter protein organizer (MatP/YcbG family)
MIYHYVYKLTEESTGKFYYGSRSCRCEPINDSYMGSMFTWKPNKKLLKKEIIKTSFISREEAVIEEAKLISENIKNPLNMNFHIPNKGFYNKSRICNNLPPKKYKMIQLDYEVFQLLKSYAKHTNSSIINTVQDIIKEKIVTKS